MCFCTRTQLRRVRVDCFCENVTHYDLRFGHVCSLLGIAVQLLSQSPHLHAKVELHPFAQSSVAPPPLLPSILAFCASYT